MSAEDEPAQGREPLFNAPWPSLVVVASILGSYLVQSRWPLEQAAATLGFAPADLDHGRWWTLLTVALVHGSWFHAIMNAVWALAFGPPVARLLGPDLRGAGAFFLFYLACAALSSLSYAALHLHDPGPVVGASGAVSGLMGAGARLIGREEGLSRALSRTVISFGAAWIITNALLAMASPIIPFMPGARIAWEAHIGGFLAGVVLIGPLAAAMGRARSR